VLSRYLAWARTEKGLAPLTLQAYGRELERLASSGYGRLEDLETEDLRAYVQSRGGRPSTVARRVAALRSYYSQFLVRTGARGDDPTGRLDRPRVHRGLPRPVDEPAAALARLNGKLRPIAVLMHETGLRLSEALALDVEMPPPMLLRVLGKGGRERLIPLSGLARDALEELGGQIPLSRRTIQRAFRAAGFTPHRLRHSFATELIESGADIGDVQQLLGHASVATTQVYAKFSTERLRRAIERRSRDG
jgi:integrase/recombinase XerD